MVDSAPAPRPRHRGRPPGGHRGRDAGGDEPAHRRGPRRHRRRRGRDRAGPRRDRARQARAADEPRARRHPRAAAQGQGRQGRRRLHRRRRRPARRPGQPPPLRQGPRACARCSSATSRACRIPTASRRRRRASPRSGARSPTSSPSFADGTKVSFEQAVGANMTGMTVAKRGCHGYTVEPGTPITAGGEALGPDEILTGPGIVDYVVGCEPGPGVWALGTIEHPRQRHYLNLYKLGEGPIYCFHTPYHLCHFEVPVTIARAALFHDAAIAPLGRAGAEVVTVAKRDLKAGEVVDELGGYPSTARPRTRRDRPGRPAADRRRRRLQAQARHPQGRGAHLRRRRDPRRPPRRHATAPSRTRSSASRAPAEASPTPAAPPSGRGTESSRLRSRAYAAHSREARAVPRAPGAAGTPPRASTSSAMASEAVRPGLSMPKRLTRPAARGLRPLDDEVGGRAARGRELRADAGIVRGERPVGELRPVAPDRRVEAVAPAGSRRIVDALDPLGVRPEAPAPGEVERQVGAEPVALGHRVDEVRNGTFAAAPK